MLFSAHRASCHPGRVSPVRAAFLSLCLVSAGFASGNLEIDDLRGEAYLYAGQLVKARLGQTDVEDYFLGRLGVALTASKTIGDLSLRGGVGGLFWQPYPTDPKAFHKNVIRFGPGVTVASAEYAFNEDLSLKGGYFDYKYTPSANLGEYLLRTESYPTMLRTGSEWTWVDSAYLRTLAVRLRWDMLGGMFRHEVGMFLENRTAPMYDITPAYLATFTPIKGVEIGGGVAFRRWIPSVRRDDPSSLASRGTEPFEQYVTFSNFPEVQYQAEVTFSDGGGQQTALAVWRPGAEFDEAAFLAANPGATINDVRIIQKGSTAGRRADIKGYLLNLEHCNADGTMCEKYLSGEDSLLVVDGNGQIVTGTSVAGDYSVRKMERKAVNLMGRATLDLGHLTGLSPRSGPFRVYAEIAVLGYENQPVYFDDRTHRMPVMVGAHIPTFGALDLLAVEFEYMRNPYPNSNFYADEPNAGLMLMPDGIDQGAKMHRYPGVRSDDVKWSAHAVRTLLPGLQLKVQLANDHLRLLDFMGSYGDTQNNTVMSRRDNWYYLARLQWGF
jgi:hypothetical protein